MCSVCGINRIAFANGRCLNCMGKTSVKIDLPHAGGKPDDNPKPSGVPLAGVPLREGSIDKPKAKIET